KYTTASTSAVLINTNVMFIAILSFLVLRESFTLKKAAGIILGFLGATIIVTNGYLDIEGSFIGDVLILLSAFCWAVYSIIGKILLKRYNPLTLNTYAFALGTIFYIPFVINDFGSIFFITLEGWLIILYLALFCSVFGYVAWYFVLSHVDASKAAIFLNLIPLFTILLSLLIGEIVTIFLIAGAACIICGIYLTQKE
ncbi:MAG: EamA/RhaT family transporter, partial [Thermoplasmata archaeon]